MKCSRPAWRLIAFAATTAVVVATLATAPASMAAAATPTTCGTLPGAVSPEVAGGPVVYDPASSYEELFGVTASGEMYQKVWLPPRFANHGWTSWLPRVGGVAGTPSAVYDPVRNTLDVFVRGTDGALDLTYWCPGHGGWQPLQSLAGTDIIGSPAAIYDPLSHNIEVYTDNVGGTVGEYAGDALHGFSFTNLDGSITGTPSPVIDSNSNFEHLEVYVRGTDGSLYQDWWSPTTSWSGWNPLQGSFTGSPAAAFDPKSGDLEVYVTNTDHTMGEKAFKPGTGLLDWRNVTAGVTGSPSPVYDAADGPMNVFDIGTGGPLFYTHGDGTTWQPWQNLGGDLTGDPAAIDDTASGYMEAFGLISSGPTAGRVFHAFHDLDVGAWQSETLGNTTGTNEIVTLAWL